MSIQQSSEESIEVTGKLAIRQADRQALLSRPIPEWPERASSLLSILFVILVAYAPLDNWVTKTIVIITFMGAMWCVWLTTSKLRQKVEALCDSARV